MTNELSILYNNFSSKNECISFLEKIRWNGVPKCPKCRSEKYSPVKNKDAYHCNFCNRTFTVTTSTLFHKSKIDLQKWFYVLSTLSEPNLTARELAEKIEVTKDTAWSIQKKIKNALIHSPQLLILLDKNINDIIYGKQ